MTWLERVATWLVRLHGRKFAANYGDDLLDTLRKRSARARSRGRAAFIAHAARELTALAWSGILQRRPEWEPSTSSDSRRALSLETLRREVHHAIRRLLRTPGFSASVVVTLALATAATTTVFSLVSSIVLAPLPYTESDRLIDLDHAAPALGLPAGMGMSIGLAREYEALLSIEAVALYTIQDGTLSDAGPARRATYLQATPALGESIGIRPQLGRWFGEADGVPGAASVAVLTDAMWRRQFGASPVVVGRMLRLEGASYEIVGVLAPASVFPDPRVEFVVPLPLPALWPRATGFNYAAVARIAAGATIEQARREQRATIASLASRYPADADIATIVDGGLMPVTRPLKDALIGEVTTTLWALLGAAAIVLLMACANLANLFLVRHEARRRQVQLQRALGARASDVALQILSEAALVAGAGAAVGHLLSALAMGAIIQWGPQGLPRLHELHLGTSALTFTALTAMAVALLTGAAPLLRMLARDRSSLADAERGGTPPPVRMAARHALMATQLALAVVVCVAAGLLARSFANVMRVDPGFQSDSRMVFDAGVARSEYRTRGEAARFHASVLDRLRMMPGIVSAAVTTNLPLEGTGIGDPLDVRGRPTVSAEAAPIVRYRRVSADYFRTMAIPLRAGRLFDAIDEDGTTPSAILDEAAARLYFPTGDLIGQQIRPADGAAEDRWLTIVGIVGNTATEHLSEAAPTPKLYVPLRGSMWADVPSPHRVSYVVHTAGDPVTQIAAVRSVLSEFNPRVAMARAERLEDVMIRARAPRALTMILLIVASAMAMIVGTVGVYAVMSYAVAQRSVEIAVRLAVGATPSQVTRRIVRSSAVVIGAGVATGLMITVTLASLVESLLFGVTPLDWPTHVAAAVVIGAVALAASWWPATRSTSRNPLQSLRQTP